MALKTLGIAAPDAVRVVEDDEVDVAGIVEFPPPQLAQAEDHQARLLLRIARVGEAEGAGLGGGPQDMSGRQPQRGFGEIR